MERNRLAGLRRRAWLSTLWKLPVQPGKFQRSFDYAVLPMIVYGLAAGFITWPLVAHLSTRYAGNELSDVVEHVRLVWWTQHALQNGLNPFYQSLFAYPDGFFSTVQWAQPLTYWPPVVISPIVGPCAAVNLWLMTIMVFNGSAAYWLGLWTLGAPERTRAAKLAALVCGLVFMAFPTVQGHLAWGHVQIISLYSLPIFAWSIYRILSGQGNGRLVILGAAALWMLVLGNYTGAVFQVFPVVLFGGGYLLLSRRKQLIEERFRSLKQLLMMFGLAVALIAPFYLPLLAEAADRNRTGYLKEVGWILFSTDPLSFVSPSPFTSWHRPFIPSYSYYIHNANVVEGVAYLGIAASALAIFAVAQRRKGVGVWIAIMVGCMIFSLGPMLKWHEQAVTYTLGLDQSHVVLPWALFQKLPLIDITRTPGRFNMTTGLALGVLAAMGLYEILKHVTHPRLQVLIGGGVMVFILAEYQLFFPFPTHTPKHSARFEQLSERDDIRAVFDVPWFETQKRALYEQLEHHKAILAGYVSRRTSVDPAKLTLLSDVASGLAWKGDSLAGQFPGMPLEADDARSILKDQGIDIIVLHWDASATASQKQWVNALGSPVYVDEQIGIFEVPAPAQPSNVVAMTHRGQYDWPHSPPNSGWWSAESSATRPDSLWLKNRGRITLYTSLPIMREFTLDLNPLVQSYQVELLVDGIPFRTWDVEAPVTTVQFWVAFEPGFHTLELVSDGCTQVPVVPTCLLDRGIEPLTETECQLPPEDRNLCVSLLVSALTLRDPGLDFREQSVKLEQGFMLRGYRIPDQACEGGSLLVETQWHTTRKLPGDYHIFIHVFDQDGQFIAQYDGIPADGNFPTTEWPASFDWSEIVSVPLPAELPQTVKRLEVYAGWYRYPDMDRLAVEGGGKLADNGLVYLTSVELSRQCQ